MMVKLRMLDAVKAFTINGDRVRRLLPAAGFLLIALFSTIPATAQSQSARITIIELDAEPVTETWRFQPAALTVAPGTRVTWLNTGRGHHTITSPEGLFDSGYLENGASWSYDFELPGAYSYFCIPNPWMKGTIIVR